MNIVIDIPDWLSEYNKNLPERVPDLQERMKLVIECARQNTREQTGGPFAAGVFEKETGRPIFIGVNRVVPTGHSSAHAEVVALSYAQKILSSWDLGKREFGTLQLVVNWRPCVMCYGAVLWSGVRSLAIAGDSKELEEITGFDEGPMPHQWEKELEKRGIEFINNIEKQLAIKGFQEFKASGSVVYNGRSSE